MFEKDFKLVHVIGTDCELATALREELEHRGIRPAKDPAKIALVAEWDTSYGRNMIEVFSQEFERDGFDLQLKSSLNHVSTIPQARI